MSGGLLPPAWHMDKQKLNKLLRMALSATGGERDNARAAFWVAADAGQVGPHDLTLLSRDGADDRSRVALDVISENVSLHRRIAELTGEVNRLRMRLMEFGDERPEETFENVKEIDRSLKRARSPAKKAMLVAKRLQIWMAAHETDRNFIRDVRKATDLGENVILRAKTRGKLIDPGILESLVGTHLDTIDGRQRRRGKSVGLTVEQQRAYVDERLNAGSRRRA